MTRDKFANLLLEATRQVKEFTKKFVWNPVPDNVIYHVYPNQSYDKRPNGQITTDFPEESLAPGQFHSFVEPDEVVAYLWRDGRVPQWINIQILDSNEKRAVISLICCGRYTDLERRMYYSTMDMGPFGVKGPPLPPEWKYGEKNEKFDLLWPKKSMNG